MKLATRVSWLALAGLLVAVAISVRVFRNAHSTAVELQASRQDRSGLEARVAETEAKLQRTEQLAAEAEQDRATLMLALKSIRPAETAASSTPAPTGTNTPTVDPDPRTDAERIAVGDRTPRGQQNQMAQERVYSQELARSRRDEAMRRAEFERLLLGLDPVGRFERRIEAATAYAAEADFQAAIRIHNQAIAEKPPDLPLPESARQLHAMLREQNTPVRVTLNSDGITFVSVKNLRAPKQFVENLVEILPGNYEVVGRRPGYRDVVVPLQVRAGALPPPVVTVICTQPLE